MTSSDARDVVLDVVAIVGAAAERGGSLDSTLETVLERVTEGFGARLAAIYVSGADGALALRAVRPASTPPAEALSPDRQPALVAALEAGRDAVGASLPGRRASWPSAASTAVWWCPRARAASPWGPLPWCCRAGGR